MSLLFTYQMITVYRTSHWPFLWEAVSFVGTEEFVFFFSLIFVTFLSLVNVTKFMRRDEIYG